MTTVAPQAQLSGDQGRKEDPGYTERIFNLYDKCQDLLIEFYAEYALITIGPRVTLDALITIDPRVTRDEKHAPLFWRFAEWGSQYGLASRQHSPLLNHISQTQEAADLTECTLKCLRDALVLAKFHLQNNDLPTQKWDRKVDANSARIQILVDCLFEIFRYCDGVLATQSQLESPRIRGKFTEIF